MLQPKNFKNRRNYYRILHVQQDAPIEVIKASYRTIMGELGSHPDMGGTHSEAIVLNEAYQTLCDSRKRVEYDFLLSLRQKKSHKVFASRKNRSNQSGDKSAPKPPPQTKSKDDDQKQHTKPFNLEKRNINRMKQQGNMSFTLPRSVHYHQGELVDLSPQGMQFISKEKIDPASRIKVKCPLLSGSARVTNCREIREGKARTYMICLNFMKVEFNHSSGAFLSVKG